MRPLTIRCSHAHDSVGGVDSPIGCCRKDSIAGRELPGAVDQRVGAGLVGADLDELLDVAQRAHEPAHLAGVGHLLRRHDRASATREIDSSTSIAGKWPTVASLRVSTMCPSRIDRAVSAIGSLWSSPSTSTV